MEYIPRPVGYSEKIVLRLIDLAIGVIELLLALRVFLHLLGANPDAEFVSWLYTTTDQMLIPFAGMFPSFALSGIYVIEFSTLFAMLVYAFIGWAIMRLVVFLTNMLFSGQV